MSETEPLANRQRRALLAFGEIADVIRRMTDLILEMREDGEYEIEVKREIVAGMLERASAHIRGVPYTVTPAESHQKSSNS